MSNFNTKLSVLMFILIFISISCNDESEDPEDTCPYPETLVFPENIEIKSVSQFSENIEVAKFQIFDGEKGFALGTYTQFPADYILFKVNKIGNDWEFSEIADSLPLNNIHLFLMIRVLFL